MSDDRAGAGRAGLSYRDAGVDLDAANRAKARLAELVASTRDRNTLSEVGAFGGLYAVPDDVEAPVLVASADGAGTKLKVAFLSGVHDSVGEDLVNHCVNDILVQGARPLFFLDYLACGEMEESVVAEVVSGIARGCRANRCSLLGGETAQMPGFYAPGEYDLAGFVVGVVPRGQILDGSLVEPGDVLLALASSGLHTNGYSLAREVVFGRMGLTVDDELPGVGESVGHALLRVHRSYLDSLLPLVSQGRLHALAHITGGGIPGNLPRVLDDGLGAVVRRSTWEVPALFRVLQEGGGIDLTEMDRVFNMGVGMIAIAAADQAAHVLSTLRDAGEDAWVLGEVTDEPGVRYEP
ncbi:MAG TPA: phosphoribosylformylglycinamidine cyclo-ligase [Longimicrobiales bacterium]